MSVCSDIVNRLDVYATIFGGRVSIARNINNPEPASLPEAWVHRWLDVATPSSATNFTVQAVEKEIAVLVAAEHEADDGVDPAAESESEIFSALIDQDFTVGSSNWPLEFVRKEIVALVDTHQLFRLTFRYLDYVRG